jgi:hypothetical protein
MAYLPDEGRKIRMPKILGQYFASKVNRIDYYESNVILIPADDLFILRVLAILERTSNIS